MLSIRDSCVGALGALCALRFWEGGRPLRASPRSSVSTGRRRVSLSMYIYIYKYSRCLAVSSDPIYAVSMLWFVEPANVDLVSVEL